MVLSKGILLKGLLGLGTLVGATTVGVVYREEIANLFTGNGGDIAVGGEGEINKNAQVDAGSQAAASSGSGDQVAETTDSQGSKGEASGKAAGAAVRKEVTVQQINEEVKKLNIENCELESDEEKSCGDLKKDAISKIRFSIEGSDDSVFEVSEMSDGVSLTLKIKKAKDLDIFTSGVKYTFNVSGENITIKKSGDSSDTNRILLMEGTNPEFTVENGRLVRAWDAEKLGKKVGLTCNVKENVCSITHEIKAIKNEKSQKLTPSGKNISETKITFSEETANYNQGFKFTVPEEGIKDENDSVILDAGKYEIKYQEGKERGWGLSPSNN